MVFKFNHVKSITKLKLRLRAESTCIVGLNNVYKYFFETFEKKNKNKIRNVYKLLS